MFRAKSPPTCSCPSCSAEKQKSTFLKVYAKYLLVCFVYGDNIGNLPTSDIFMCSHLFLLKETRAANKKGNTPEIKYAHTCYPPPFFTVLFFF